MAENKVVPFRPRRTVLQSHQAVPPAPKEEPEEQPQELSPEEQLISQVYQAITARPDQVTPLIEKYGIPVGQIALFEVLNNHSQAAGQAIIPYITQAMMLGFILGYSIKQLEPADG